MAASCFLLKSVGLLREGTIKLGDVTVLAGRPNTGKSYAAKIIHSIVNAPRYFSRFIAEREPPESVLKAVSEGLNVSFERLAGLESPAKLFVAEVRLDESLLEELVAEALRRQVWREAGVPRVASRQRSFGGGRL